MRVPIVFISYSHDSDEHRDRVLALSERLRKDGIETRLDQYLNGTPDETWPRWMLNRLDEADYVLVVATETYYRRFRGHEEPEKGLGVDWEGAVITQQIYEARSNTVKFVPVLFAPDQRQSIPEPLRGRTDYVLTSEASYQALYDFLLGQAGVEPGEIGKPRVKPRRNGKPLAFDGSSDENPREAAGAKEYLAAANISPSRLRHVAAKLFGREDDLACLDAAWSNNTTSVLTVVAWGGVGKTSLVATWAARLAVRNYDGARYYDWSFYSQGTKEQGEASSDQFIAHALEFFGDAEMADSPRSAWDKGARLAQLIAQQRTLLILDGLEPLQYPPGPLAGELRDPALTALLKGLAQRNSSGLCLITTRESVRDLEAFHDTTATEWRLDHLSIEAGVALLRSLGVYGTPAEFESLVGDVNGHALTLKLVGGYLARAHAGDIRRRDHIAFEEADAEIQGGHAFKAMKAYEHWLSEGQKQGERQLAILRLLGLFDRPADLQCLAALRDAPIIKGLTEPVVGITDSVWNVAITSLAEGGLIAIETDSPVDGSPPRTIDAHPLIREYFAAQMAQQQPAAWRTAHSRMFDHLQESAEEQPDTLMALQPLYQAVTHGCLAGRYEEALNGVYWPRILRGPEFYAITKLGAVGADLGAITRFFDTPWSRVSESLSTSNQSFLLSQAAYCLRALGRLTEALQPIRASWRMDVDAEDWVNASVSGGNLSELELLLGNIDAAVSDAKQCISYAERTAEHHLHVTTRTRLANTLHQSGLTSDALALFAEAETIQGRVDATFPILYSLRGFQYCDALLSEIECVTWREFMKKTGSRASAEGPAAAHHEELLATVERRALQTLSWAQTNRYASLLDIALQQLTLGQIACYRAVLAKLQARGTGQIGQADVEHLASRRINAAVTSLRRAGLVTHLVRGFLSRAQLCVVSNDFRSGEQDLNEAWQISERGPMRLHMADIHLNRARLFHAVKPYPWESPHKDLISARKHIEQCGYWRRRDELEDTEAAAREW